MKRLEIFVLVLSPLLAGGFAQRIPDAENTVSRPRAIPNPGPAVRPPRPGGTVPEANPGLGLDPGTFTEAPPPILVEAVDPNAPTVGPGLLGDEWDSGAQQCDINGLKILYRFQKVNSPSAGNPHHWSIYYTVGAEDKKTFGPGWKYGYGITSIYYNLSYGPNTTPITGTLPLGHVATQSGFLTYGSGQGGFTAIQIRVSRSGGSSGIHVDWPGGSCAPG